MSDKPSRESGHAPSTVTQAEGFCHGNEIEQARIAATWRNTARFRARHPGSAGVEFCQSASRLAQFAFLLAAAGKIAPPMKAARRYNGISWHRFRSVSERLSN